MMRFFPLLLVLVSATVSAEWVKVIGAADTNYEKFIDTKAIRQTGPMNTMRRVWELTNLAKTGSNNASSTKSYVEYDCKDRRVRVLEENSFSETWAQGVNLSIAGKEGKHALWSEIGKGSASEIIFNRVCPNDDPD